MKNFIACLLLLNFAASPAYSALNDAACAASVVAAIGAVNPIQDTGVATTYWTAICKGILDHFKAAGAINLLAGDLTIPATGLLDSLSAPVTGSASSAATGPLVGRIQ